MHLLRLHIWVEGKVQGIGYRNFVRGQASERGVHGWVKNLNDGRVEMVLEGIPEKVREVEHLAGEGPSGARITSFEAREEGVRSEKGFKILS